MPVPLNATLCGEPEALSENESVADFAPVDAGAKTTLTLQDAETPTLPPPAGHVVPDAILNSDAFVPLIAIELTFNGKLPVLLSPAVCGALEVPTLCEPKSSVAGAMLAVGAAAVPVPVSATNCDAAETFPELSVNAMVAVKGPIV